LRVRQPDRRVGQPEGEPTAQAMRNRDGTSQQRSDKVAAEQSGAHPVSGRHASHHREPQTPKLVASTYQCTTPTPVHPGTSHTPQWHQRAWKAASKTSRRPPARAPASGCTPSGGDTRAASHACTQGTQAHHTALQHLCIKQRPPAPVQPAVSQWLAAPCRAR